MQNAETKISAEEEANKQQANSTINLEGSETKVIRSLWNWEVRPKLGFKQFIKGTNLLPLSYMDRCLSFPEPGLSLEAQAQGEGNKAPHKQQWQ